jgi:hypothetical protein
MVVPESMQRDLFGGAITAVIPTRLIDASYVLSAAYAALFGLNLSDAFCLHNRPTLADPKLRLITLCDVLIPVASVTMRDREPPNMRLMLVMLRHLLHPDLRRDIRQVPDTQEVLLYPDSDVSLIFEILERVDEEDPQDAAKFCLPSSIRSATNNHVW